MGYDPHAPATGKGQASLDIPRVEGMTVFINRISNGFLVQHEGRCAYCEKAEDISGVVVSAFAHGKLTNDQFELFTPAKLIPWTIDRPLNQPIV